MEKIDNHNINNEKTNPDSYIQEQEFVKLESSQILLWAIALILLVLIVSVCLICYFYSKNDMQGVGENQSFLRNEPQVEAIYKGKNEDIGNDIIEKEDIDNTTNSNKTGLIKGSLSYPGGRIPSLKICAISQVDNEEYCTNKNIKGDEFLYNNGYKIEVPEGKYYVYAFGGGGDLSNNKAYYTKKIKCEIENNCIIKINLSDIDKCNLACGKVSTMPAEIVVNADEVYFDASPSDWYSNN